MATTLGSAGAARMGSGDGDMSLWYDSKWYKFGMALMLLVAIF
ncbi:MAG: methane monooxygenase/ammonia monooxygenase subunit C, partial [Nitrosomonadaceae bacterium]|nr:methane monooxygenase/ammonia monooxygenase subunit C [Nitrosomonadaceae bacterium]